MSLSPSPPPNLLAQQIAREEKAKPKARAYFRADGMNATERSYAEHLEQQRRAKHIQSYAFECLKLRLADGTFYTPDFFVVAADGTLEIHETKGFMREAARVRLNVAADKYPFRFRLVKLVSQRWEITDV